MFFVVHVEQDMEIRKQFILRVCPLHYMGSKDRAQVVVLGSVSAPFPLSSLAAHKGSLFL